MRVSLLPGQPRQEHALPGLQEEHFSSRLVRNVFHPFKPVGTYYAGGCYVPIYDLDPLVPGVGPYPYGIFKRGSTEGADPRFGPSSSTAAISPSIG